LYFSVLSDPKKQLDERLRELTFHIDGSSFPNWIAADPKRINVTLAGDEPKWTQPTPAADGPPAQVVWRRAK